MGRRPLEQLTSADPAWPALRTELLACGRPIDIAPIGPVTGDRTLLALQVTDRSPMGAIARNTGGIRVDDGWITVFGAGRDGLLSFNPWLDGRTRDDGAPVEPVLEGALVVGADAIGGFFLVDGGVLGSPGGMFHLEPDTLELQSMDGEYSDWLRWVTTGDLDGCYGALRWPGWRAEVGGLPAGRGLHLFPPPFTAEGKDPATVSRRAVPLRELWSVAWLFRRELGLGAPSPGSDDTRGTPR